MNKTNAERQKKWRDTHKEQKKADVKRYRAKYRAYNDYMDDWEDHQRYLEYRKLSGMPYHSADMVFAGISGWKVISINDKAGQLWLKEKRLSTKH